MAYLDPHPVPLTAQTAAHLLRRATFGPTPQEISDFTGKTAEQAVDLLISNAAHRATPPPPVEMDETRPDAGQPFLNKPFDVDRIGTYTNYIQYWWIGLMAEQTGKPSVLEKLTAFWQNHFPVIRSAVDDYRYMDQYLRFLRANALGNFRQMVVGMTKDPGMLIFQNGNENSKEQPNENYGRELQELFTVGQLNYAGDHNYTEDDVKAAARVLTGWQAVNYRQAGTTSIGTVFTPERHDTASKTFSSYYNNTVISGRSGATAGEEELQDLVAMLLRHPETPKFICRKLYRWYVNPNVTQEIEDQVIGPLAAFFASPANNYAIAPVLRKLLTSTIFYDARSVGAIVKSPAEFMLGTVRWLELPVPDLTTDFAAFQKMMGYLSSSMTAQQLYFLNQPSVFGSLPYYQIGYSKNWINGTTLGLRGARSDGFVQPWLEVKPGYMLGMDILAKLRAMQPNFPDVAGTAALTCEQVLAEFSRNLYAVPLTTAQNDFLIDKIMMMNSSPRTTWQFEWNAYRSDPTNTNRQNTILWRGRALLKYMLRMAEYQVF